MSKVGKKETPRDTAQREALKRQADRRNRQFFFQSSLWSRPVLVFVLIFSSSAEEEKEYIRARKSKKNYKKVRKNKVWSWTLKHFLFLEIAFYVQAQQQLDYEEADILTHLLMFNFYDLRHTFRNVCWRSLLLFFILVYRNPNETMNPPEYLFNPLNRFFN